MTSGENDLFLTISPLLRCVLVLKTEFSRLVDYNTRTHVCFRWKDKINTFVLLSPWICNCTNAINTKRISLESAREAISRCFFFKVPLASPILWRSLYAPKYPDFYRNRASRRLGFLWENVLKECRNTPLICNSVSDSSRNGNCGRADGNSFITDPINYGQSVRQSTIYSFVCLLNSVCKIVVLCLFHSLIQLKSTR